jgi:hypothetical protein
MALIVEDGTGVAGAESLATVAFADAYHAARGNTAWATIDLTVKEQLMRKATDYAAVMYGPSMAGVSVFVNQPLPFPRNLWPTVPVVIQQAIVELALIARTTPLLPNITRGKKMVKVGPLEVQYDGNSATSTNFVAASLRFAPFLSTLSAGPFAKLVRT